jgi:Zn-finger nucleic acid-binding protein
MKCPNDSATLVMSERSGVEIDYCPECRGVWLDRGELDKILDRAQAETVRSAPPSAAPPRPTHDERDRRYDDRDRRYDDYRGGQGGYKRKKKEHWLEELFG